MGALWAIYLIFVFFAVSNSSLISRKYTAKPEKDDRKSNEELLGEYNAKSDIQCAARCLRNCSVFGFNPQMKKCRTHKEMFTSGVSREEGWRYYLQDFMPIDCKDLHGDGYFDSGVYDIYPHGTITSPVRVYCQMEIMGGGWTAIQKRVNGSVSFDLDWTAYKNGFGSPEQDVWVGNDLIHQLTKDYNSFLYVSITLQNGTTLYELYDRFSVSSETEKYQLFLAAPATGALGDSILNTGFPTRDLSGMSFTTKDRDNDPSSVNCAANYDKRGGWWFNRCHRGFLNGPWYPADWDTPWYPAVEEGTSIRGTVMMIKRH